MIGYMIWTFLIVGTIVGSVSLCIYLADDLERPVLATIIGIVVFSILFGAFIGALDGSSKCKNIKVSGTDSNTVTVNTCR